MLVAVVGGAGYIGSHVVLALLEAGHRVVVFDNLSTGFRANVPSDAAFFEGDFLVDEDTMGFLSAYQPDAAIHLGALKAAGESMLVPETYAHHNIVGSIQLLNALLKAGCSRVVFSSSAAVYGEPQYLPMDEKHPTQPINFYGHSKRAFEEILAWYQNLGKVRFASLRYFNAAGYDLQGRVPHREVGTANLIPVVMEVAAGLRRSLAIFGQDYPTPDGTCIRDYIHVWDLALAHVAALEALSEQPALICNLGTGRGNTVLEVLAAAEAVVGQAIPHSIEARRPGDPATLTANWDRAKQVLGWEPKHSALATIMDTSWRLYKPLQSCQMKS